jgi:hypothetical protein
MYGGNDSKGRSSRDRPPCGPDWYAIFKDLHAGMIYDAAGNQKEAGKRLEHAYKLDATALRVVEAYGSWVSRNRSPKEALTIFETFDKSLPRHPLVSKRWVSSRLAKKLPPACVERAGRSRRGLCTGSAPRSDAAAEKTWVSFICSCRSSLCPGPSTGAAVACGSL